MQKGARCATLKRIRRSAAQSCRQAPAARSTGSRLRLIPDTGLFYVAENNQYSIFYLPDTDPRGSMGLGGHEESRAGSGGSFLTAIDYKTGKAAWRYKYEGGAGGGGGVLTTAGRPRVRR